MTVRIEISYIVLYNCIAFFFPLHTVQKKEKENHLFRITTKIITEKSQIILLYYHVYSIHVHLRHIVQLHLYSMGLGKDPHTLKMHSDNSML